MCVNVRQKQATACCAKLQLIYKLTYQMSIRTCLVIQSLSKYMYLCVTPRGGQRSLKTLT